MNPFRYLFLLIIVTSDTMSQQLGPFVEILRKSRQTSRNTNWKMDEILPQNYNYLVVPTINNTALEIEVAVSVLSFRSIKEKSLSFAVEVFFHQYWTDLRLQSPTGLSPNVKLRLDRSWKERLWTPDTYFRNAIDGSVSNIIDPILYFTIQNQTKVFMAVKLTLEFSCDMNFVKYPFDTQKCSFELSSLSSSIEVLTYKWKKFHITKHIYLPQFEISNVSVQNCVKIYEDVGTFSCLRASLTLRRNVGNFIIKRYIPSFLIVILTFLGFWIPTAAYPARVGLTITALLALISQQTQEDLNVSYIYALSVWMFLCITFVFATLVEFSFAICVIQNTINKSDDNLNEEIKRNENKKKNSLTKLMNFITKSNSRNNCIDMYSRIAFPLSFLIVILIYTIIYVY